MAIAKNRANASSPISTSGIRDNHRRGTVGDFLKTKIQSDSTLSIVSAYFTIYAFEALKQELTAIADLRFLFGEPRFVRSLDPDRTDKKSFKIEDEDLQLQNRLEQKRVARECADWIKEKVQIRSVTQVNLLHGKMYHMDHHGVEDAIMGSSNFTVRGLGLGSAGNNLELNLEVDSKRDRQDLKTWFDELWNDEALVEEVKDEVLHYLEQLYQNHCPQFIYYKTLFHIFEKFLADQDASGLLSEKSQLVDTEIWQTLFEFQKDGAKGAINKIRAHNGCIIADSVGLGKTFEALAIIKYFELLNYRVLVLCPKKLRENWTIYQAQNNSELNPFVKDRFSYTVLSHTDLSRDSGLSGDINLETINWGNYDLVVIDESHNFRNNTSSRRDEEGTIIRKSRYERLMDDVLKTGIKTKVLLLSATPVNNDLKDLRNQLYFLTEGRDEAFRESFGITSLKETLATAQRTFTNWAKQQGERRTIDLLEKLSSGFFKLLDELTIARSRQHIQRYYKDSIAELGGFPERLRPLSIYPKIDLRGRFPSYDKINDEISDYQLSLFNPAKYVLPQYQMLYDRDRAVFSQGDREHFLIGMMKVNFLKRLESSVSAFAITMDNTIQKIEELQERITRFQTLHSQSVEVEAIPMTIAELDDEELRDAMQVGQKLIYQMAHLDVEAWLEDLDRDKDQLVGLYNSASAISVDRDAKLAELKKLIAQKVQSPTINKQDQPNRKVLIFTAFADTAVYLYESLSSWARSELNIQAALVTGDTSRNKTTFGKSEFNQILTNFSPIAKKRSKILTMPQDGEIDLLIATDCISEGQNLQDCDYLVNYDIHWNPVRIIQRFGRIDRIGSLSSTVQMVNFWPTEDLNKYINLKNRVEARMALVDIAATQEDNLLATVEDIIQDDLKYRDKQLLRLKDEVLDLEDFTETVSLTEFTLDDFRLELSKYIESNRQLLQDAPLGLYAVVPPHPDYNFIAPGVIFCLRQKGDSGSEAVNPLQPHFLVYVRDDRVVRFTFAQPKQILEIYRLLCAEKTTPYEQLCNLFDQQTCQGNDMSVYSELLQAAIASIVTTFRKRSLSNLQSSRSAVLIEVQSQVEKTTDFELITWLVIQNEA
ncbi:ATP-dependent helicase [Phormidesmis priestleyi ULC007]|uniref:ATP-dependent helicase n=1 Tax=Phormidesmis priestleyi ULC007 TaxID=1920490 RepID=A0A2T1DDY4_9CYAN|nr:helicase-related protein [Phormidesmis priestleyi]PSB18685.1 ATP-dependent helicase [Phormidesmis priestleyi ULC007]PZO51554.1 MAG: ATP-dependent helicase [Phormidesmis priestleyi]